MKSQDRMLHFQEKKGPVGSEKRYVYSESAQDFVPLLEEHDSGKIATVQERVKGWVREAFLPQGYPDSVSSDYLHYQFWDSVQAYCSNIAGALSLQATLTGLGVGEATATPLAATLTWLLKDGSGMISSIAFAYWRGTQLDCNSKQWRLFADVANDASHFLKLVAPLLPVPFIAVMCFSDVMRSLVGVAGGATRAAFSSHQARSDNMADVSAKDGSQETMVNFAALITSITILPYITSNLMVTWLTFLLCIVLHLLTNYLAVRAVKMESLNRPRLLHVLQSWFSTAAVPGIEETNQAEPLFSGPAFIPDFFPFDFRLFLGGSLHSALQSFSKESDCKAVYSDSIETFAQENFMLVGELTQRHLFIIYRQDLSPRQELEAFFTAYLTVLNYVHLREDVVLSSEHISQGLLPSTPANEIIPVVKLHAKKIFPDFLESLKAKGWYTNKMLLAAGEWRVQ